MMVYFRIALRNLIKNRRRSCITILTVALGYAAVSLFSGFAEYMYRGNREVAIYGSCNGHINIFRKGFLNYGQIDPARYLLSPPEIASIMELCRQIPEIRYVAPQLMVSGLVTNGKVSVIFIAQGVVPSAQDFFWSRSDVEEMKEFEGRKLEDDCEYGIAVTRGLASLLGLEIGSDAVLFANTIDGRMNALEIQVFQLFDTYSDNMNDKVMKIPFSLAQSLYDTEGCDKLTVLLDETHHTKAVYTRLQKLFAEKGLTVDMRTWEEMSEWYRKVKDMFDVIFVFVFVIVFVIVVMSVVNTMGMAVIERTREIGTLRSLGLKRKGVAKLFGVEGTLLGILGSLAGICLYYFGMWSVAVFEPTWNPPGVTQRVPIQIIGVPETMAFSFVFLVALCLAASLVPARRAARLQIVDALGHV